MKYEIRPPQAIYEIGLRENQEDSLFPATGKATSEDRLFMLCDGMGGHQSGEVASQTVCEEIGKYVLNETDASRPFTDAMLAEAVERAYDALDGKDNTDSEKKMGTTMVFIYFHAGGVMAAHIGDSRYYHIRPKTREIRYRSRDHSLANMSFEAGEVSLQNLPTMPGRNVILRAMMPHQDVREMPDIVHIKDIRPGDYFFACSDGVLERMDDEELMNVLCNKELSDEQKRDWLLASTDGNKDNHSAWLIQVAGVMSEEIDEYQPDDEAEARMKNKLLLAELGEISEELPVEEPSTPQVFDEPKSMPQPEKTHANFNMPPANEKSGKKPLPWMWIALAALALIACGAIGFVFFGQDSKNAPQIRYEKVEGTPRTIQPSTSDRSEAETPATSPVTRQQQNGSKENTTEGTATSKNEPAATGKGKANGTTTVDIKTKVKEKSSKDSAESKKYEKVFKDAKDRNKSGDNPDDDGDKDTKNNKPSEKKNNSMDREA